MVDNIKQIAEFMTFSSPDDYYVLAVFDRSINSKSKAKILRAWNVSSVDLFYEKMEIAKCLCKCGKKSKVRAVLFVNRKSFKHTVHKTLQGIAQIVETEDWATLEAVCLRAATISRSTEKTFVLDIDHRNKKIIDSIIQHLEDIAPTGIDKVRAVLPSNQGYHILTHPFDTLSFDSMQFPYDIHKNNFTNVYIP